MFTLVADMNMHICSNGVGDAVIEEKDSTPRPPPPPSQKQAPVYEENKYQCKYCLKSFASSRQLDEHVTTHPDVKKAICPYCRRKFSTVSNLRVHVRLHTGEKPYTCPRCNEAFGTIRQKKAHVKGNTCKPYSCKLCLKNFDHHRALNSHMRQHKYEKRKVKSENLKIASGKEKVSVKGNSSTPFSCSICHKTFSHQLALNSHKKIHKSLGEIRGAHSCPRCHKSFSTTSNVRKHIRIVRCQALPNCTPFVVAALESQTADTPDTDYPDESEPAVKQGNEIRESQTRARSNSVPVIAGMESLEPEMLQSRNRRASLSQVAVSEKESTDHSTEDTNPCSGGRFSKAGQLMQARHLRKITSGEVGAVETEVEYLNAPLKVQRKTCFRRYLTKYPCTYCSKRFTRAKLTEHLRIHTGEKPYRCDFCGMQFSQKGNWKRHVALHPKDKPYRCAKCKKHFSTKHVLRKHNEQVDCKAVYRKGDTVVKPKKSRGGSYSGCGSEVAMEPMDGYDKKCSRDGRNEVVKKHRKDYICNHCGVEFQEPFAFKSHKCDTTTVRPYACEYCSNRYFLNHHRKRHIKTAHFNSPSHDVAVNATAKFVCPHCNKTYHGKASYNHHLRLHSVPRRHKCKCCGKAFLTASLLKYHSAKHSNKRAFSCDECGGRFKLQKYLNAHRKICPGPTTV